VSKVRVLHGSPVSYVPLAQPDRAFDYESKGQEFESLRARHFGDIAQLVEHLPCKQGVSGSNPLISTRRSSIAQLVERPTVNRMVTGSSPVRGAIPWRVGEAA
jgi:hypothetical protein